MFVPDTLNMSQSSSLCLFVEWSKLPREVAESLPLEMSRRCVEVALV